MDFKVQWEEIHETMEYIMGADTRSDNCTVGRDTWKDGVNNGSRHGGDTCRDNCTVGHTEGWEGWTLQCKETDERIDCTVGGDTRKYHCTVGGDIRKDGLYNERKHTEG